MDPRFIFLKYELSDFINANDDAKREDDVLNFILYFIYSLFVLLSTSKIEMLIKFIQKIF
jgi:hypothetical protein